VKAYSRYGKDAVGIPLNHKRGHVDASQVFAEVFMPRWNAKLAPAETPAAMFQLTTAFCIPANMRPSTPSALSRLQQVRWHTGNNRLDFLFRL
jgi:hypothetical protein